LRVRETVATPARHASTTTTSPGLSRRLRERPGVRHCPQRKGRTRPAPPRVGRPSEASASSVAVRDISNRNVPSSPYV
jgi:hypothetical protein